MQTIRAIVTKVNENEDTGRVFVHARYETPGGMISGKFGGYLKGLREGDCFLAEGEWGPERKHRGKLEQVFNAKDMRPDFPQTPIGIEEFLAMVLRAPSSASIPGEFGITRAAIRELVTTYGTQVLAAAADQPAMLTGLSNNPAQHATSIRNEWATRTRGWKAVTLMEASGLNTGTIERIVSAWQNDAMIKLRQNPYVAARIPKVGFHNADRVGQHLGFDLADARRLSEAVMEVLQKRREEGSTCADIHSLLDDLSEVSGVNEDILIHFLQKAADNGDQPAILFKTPSGEVLCATLRMYSAEATIVNSIAEKLTSGRRNDLARVREAAKQIFANPPFSKFDAVQRSAVEMAASEPISIITGGPGTGKSTVMEAVAALCDIVEGGSKTYKIENGKLLLAAPTGKAAKRLSETTRRKAITLHRMLKSRPNRETGLNDWGHNINNPLPSGCTVVVDETSMLDTFAMAALMNALPANGRLILVGDRNQLESVDAGAVLSDLLTSTVGERRIIPSIELTRLYRQDKDSGIAIGAALIREGRVPDLTPKDVSGVSFNSMSTSDICNFIEKLVCEKLPSMGLDPLRDIAVLVPQKSGPAGTNQINARLSARLNPRGASIPGVALGKEDDCDQPIPRIGDRVMQTENDGENDIANGDLGVIISAGKGSNGRNIFSIRYDDGREFSYPATQWRNAILAYAGTVHRSQGSQYEAVIMPFVQEHSSMLNRSLIYTGWTRAKSRLFLMGNHDVLDEGVTRAPEQRMTLIGRFFQALDPSNLLVHNAIDWQAIADRARASMYAPIVATKSPRLFHSSHVASTLTPRPTPALVPKESAMVTPARLFSTLKRPAPHISEKPKMNTATNTDPSTIVKNAPRLFGARPIMSSRPATTVIPSSPVNKLPPQIPAPITPKTPARSPSTCLFRPLKSRMIKTPEETPSRRSP
jgi:exodeoxyribonuclease V alpha subunit